MFRRPYRSGCVCPIVSGNSCTAGTLDAEHLVSKLCSRPQRNRVAHPFLSNGEHLPASGTNSIFSSQFTVCVNGRLSPAQPDTPPFRSGDIQRVGHQMTGVGLHALVNFP